MTLQYCSESDIRQAFWAMVGGMPAIYRGKRQNDLPANVRMAWADFVDDLARQGRISDSMAQRVTL